MFCLYLQLDGLRQLNRIRPDTGRELTATVDGILARSAAAVLRQESGLFLYAFPRSCEGDHRVALDAAMESLEEIRRYDDELTGYTVVIDYLGSESPEDAFRRLRSAVSRFTEDRAAWIGPGAASPLAGEVAVSQHGEYLRIENPERPKARTMASCFDFLRNDDFVDTALDLIEQWINGVSDPGLLLIQCEDPAYARVNAQQLIRRVYGASADRPVVTLFASEREDETLAPIANSISLGSLPQMELLLGGTERRLWQEVVPSLIYTAGSPAGAGLFDHLENDVVTAYSLFLTAACQSVQRDLLPFFIMLEEVDRFSVDAVRFLRRAYDRLTADSVPIIVATSRTPNVPVGLADLKTQSLTLPLFSGGDIAARADEHLSEAAERQIRITDCMRRTRGLPLELYYYFVNVQESLDRPASQRLSVQRSTRGGEAAVLLRRLTQDDREILAIAALLGGRGTADLVVETALRLGYDRLLVRKVIRSLVGLGLLRSELSLYVGCADLRQTVLAALASDRQRVEAAVSNTLLDFVAEKKVRLTPSLLSVVMSRSEVWLPALRDMLRHALDTRRFERVAQVLTLSTRLASRAGRGDVVTRIVQSAELRRALLLGNEVRADRLFHSRSPFEAQAPFEKSVEGDAALEHARYVLAKGNQQQGITLCKRAILLFQESMDTEALSRANLEFGLVLLGQEKLSEARDYFIMARSKTDGGGETLDAVRARIAELTCLFLAGELTRVKDQIASMYPQVQQLGLRSTELFLHLLLGRVYFDLGLYRDSLTVFERGHCAAVVYEQRQARNVMRSWVARCLAHLGDCDAALHELGALQPTAEVRLFRAEALERISRFEEALAVLSSESLQVSTVFRSPEQYAWESGFASIEDRAIGRFAEGDTVLSHLTKAFSAYLLALTGNADESIAEFHRLTRQEKVSPIDPYNSLYYFLYSEALPWSNRLDREDRLTVLGRSVRHMRERSSRIDLYQDKRAFLTSNYWNKQLLESARSHNLL